MKPILLEKTRAFTIAEVLIASAVSAVLSVILIVGAVVIQKNFQASNRYARNVAQQTRLLDYLSMDLRRALTVASANGELNLTLPDFYDANGNPRNPTLTKGVIDYGSATAPQRVRFYKQGNKMLRTQGSQTEVVAEDVQDFELTFRDEGQVVEVSVSFLPTFRQDGTGNRESTKTFVRTLLRNKRQA